MNRLLPFLLLLAACGKSVGTEPARTVCTFKFSETPRCTYSANARSFNVTLQTRKLAEDEIALLEAPVSVSAAKSESQIYWVVGNKIERKK